MDILIVDDEVHIREGLRRTIEAAFPQVRVWTEDSAEAALERLEEVPAEIVLADIMMGGMSGLDMIAAGKERFRGIRWIILSAHSDFGFAQEALRQGAADYLLKPIGKAKLVELLTRLQDQIARERTELTSREMLSRNLRLLREAAFQRLAEGLDVGAFDVSSLAERYPVFRLAMIVLEPGNDEALSHFIVENVLTDLIEARGRGFVFSLDRQTVLGLISEDGDGGSDDRIREIRETLERCLKRTFGLKVSRLLRDFRDLPEAFKEMKVARPQGNGEAARKDGNPSGIVAIAIQYIHAHYQEELSLEKVAAAVFMNAAYFSQLFKQKTGHGYKEYVIQLRMEKAAELLKETSLKVSEVADRVGYQDVRHFTQVFRKTHHTTPTEYRQENQRKT